VRALNLDIRLAGEDLSSTALGLPLESSPMRPSVLTFGWLIVIAAHHREFSS